VPRVQQILTASLSAAGMVTAGGIAIANVPRPHISSAVEPPALSSAGGAGAIMDPLAARLRQLQSQLDSAGSDAGELRTKIAIIEAQMAQAARSSRGRPAATKPVPNTQTGSAVAVPVLWRTGASAVGRHALQTSPAQHAAVHPAVATSRPAAGAGFAIATPTRMGTVPSPLSSRSRSYSPSRVSGTTRPAPSDSYPNPSDDESGDDNG
jgi:hypothetical protein